MERNTKHKNAKGLLLSSCLPLVPLQSLFYERQYKTFSYCMLRNNAQPATNSKPNPQHTLFTSTKMSFFSCCSVKQSQTIILAIHHSENSFYKQISTLSPGEQLQGSKNRMLRFCYPVLNISTEHWSGWSASVC